MFYADATHSFTESCYNNDWIGDGFCDDPNNNENCDYDGGDCCGNEVDKTHCLTCACHTSEGIFVVQLIFFVPVIEAGENVCTSHCNTKWNYFII